MSQARPYRLFDVTLARKVALTPWMTRLTFAGDEVGRMRSGGPDQRIKILFPREDRPGYQPAAAGGAEDYAAYRALPLEQRGAIRTYTIRHLRPGAGEVDVDFVLHGDTGPASRWASRAGPGEALRILAPSADFAGDARGYEWRPPAGVRQVLLIADETALPALAAILESLAALPRPPAVQAFIDAPAGGCAGIDLPSWPSLDLAWLKRAAGAHAGSGMLEAVRRARLPARAAAELALSAVDIDRDILWNQAETADDGFYAWVAGEAAAVLAIRALLIRDAGLDRDSLNLMGYWREGRALDDAPARAGAAGKG